MPKLCRMLLLHFWSSVFGLPPLHRIARHRVNIVLSARSAFAVNYPPSARPPRRQLSTCSQPLPNNFEHHGQPRTPLLPNPTLLFPISTFPPLRRRLRSLVRALIFVLFQCRVGCSDAKVGGNKSEISASILERR